MKKMMEICLLALAMSALSMTPPARAQADSETFHFSQTSTQTRPNPCNGEPVVLTVEATLLIHRTIDSDGGFHFHATSNLHGDGVGQVTGANYRLNSVATSNFNSVGATNETLWQDAVAVAEGNVPNFLFQEIEHFTINANGDVTVDFENAFVKCQG